MPEKNTRKQIDLKEKAVLGLDETVRLRREKDGVILYCAARQTGIGDDEIRMDIGAIKRLSPSTAMMLALFDGKRSLRKVFQDVKYILDESSLTFTDFCKELEPFILPGVEPFKFGVPVLIEVTDNIKQRIRHYAPESLIMKEDKFCPAKLQVLKFPIKVDIMPSMDCFTNCVYCYMGRHIAPKYVPLPFSRWKELLEEMREYQLHEITFGGGDPMHYEHTIDMLEIVSTFDPTVYMYVATKAYISMEMAQRISCIPNLEFQISLDSSDPEIADAMVQTKGYGKRAIKSLKNLVKAGITPAVKAVVTPATIKAMPQTILDLHNMGVYPIRVASYTRSLFHHKDEFFNKASEWKKFNEQVEEIQAKHEFKIQIQGSTPEDDPEYEKPLGIPWNERNACTIGKSQVLILPDGTLLGCEQVPQIPENFLGSVAKDSLYNVWNSEDFKKKAYDIPREKYMGTICYDCKEFEECHSALGRGYCMRESAKLFGTIYAPDPNCPYVDQKKFKLPRQQ